MKLFVLIPVFNNLSGLEVSLQSLRDDELPPCGIHVVVVDDGSQQKIHISPEQYPELTITVLHQANQGIEGALNTGLRYIETQQGDYVARLDAGDACTNARLVKQLAFMESNPDYAMVGGAVNFVDPTQQNASYTQHYPVEYKSILQQMHLNNCFCHPVVFIRMSALLQVNFYRVRYVAAEDYDLFYQLTRRFKVANLPDVILNCEDNPAGITRSKRKVQLWSRILIQVRHFDVFCWYSYYGLMRSLAVYLLPQKVIHCIRPRKGDMAI